MLNFGEFCFINHLYHYGENPVNYTAFHQHDLDSHYHYYHFDNEADNDDDILGGIGRSDQREVVGVKQERDHWER